MSEGLKGYPKAIPDEPGVTHIGARHAEKDASNLENLENQQQLTEQGREDARKDAEGFYRYILSVVPLGGIVSLSSSTIERAVETRNIFLDTLLELIQNNKDHAATIIVINRYRADGTPRSDKELSRATSDTRARYLILDEKADEDFGYRLSDGPDNIIPFNKGMEFFKDEHLMSMIWSAQPHELPELIERLYAEVRSRSGELTPLEEDQLLQEVVATVEMYLKNAHRTPEELVANQLEAVERNVGRSLAIRPERRHVSHVVQHAPGLSFLALALFAEGGISYKNYNSLGDYQGYLEAMSFDIDPDGNIVFVEFRNNRSSIEPVSLRAVIDSLYEKASLRQAAWRDFFSPQLSKAA